MKTHKQQEDQQRQKIQKALGAAEVATITRPASPMLLHPDHMSMVKRQLEIEDHDIIRDLEDVMDESNIIDGEFLQDDEL